MKSFLKNLIPQWIKKSLSYENGDDYAFKSYSQEGEDALLNRIFGNISEGIYIDVGAHHPHRFSNTYALYKRGWSGVCIDPNPHIGELFRNMRPRDIFLNIGISEIPSELIYYQYEHPAYNTCDKDLMDLRTNIKPVSKTTIKTDTLSNALSRHLNNSTRINLITIDVEGMDFEVLKSNDWSKFAPDWLILESDNSNIMSYLRSDKHQFMCKNGYELHSKLVKSFFYRKL